MSLILTDRDCVGLVLMASSLVTHPERKKQPPYRDRLTRAQTHRLCSKLQTSQSPHCCLAAVVWNTRPVRYVWVHSKEGWGTTLVKTVLLPGFLTSHATRTVPGLLPSGGGRVSAWLPWDDSDHMRFTGCSLDRSIWGHSNTGGSSRT